MNKDNFWFTASDGKEIYVHTWFDVVNPKGLVQLIHGMGEHGKRYENFARFLNQQGYLVFASDHRGHGETAQGIENIGKIKRDEFRKMKDDEIELSEMMKKQYHLPLYLIAHSFGSFIAQRYIIHRSDLPAKVILIGSGSASRWQTIPGSVVTGLVTYLKGDYYRSYLVEKMVLGDFNRRISNPKTIYDWINSDEVELEKYIQDPYCGAEFSVGYYHALATGLSQMYTQRSLRKIRKDLPIYIIAGTEDPVGVYGKALERLIRLYKRVGLVNVTSKFFLQMRHEILNEKHKERVYADIQQYLEQ